MQKSIIAILAEAGIQSFQSVLDNGFRSKKNEILVLTRHD
jgi:hypothetical protein